MPSNLLQPEEKMAIKLAIKSAELNTSGEIRVHIEKRCPGKVLDRAAKVFGQLNMHKTELRNGVLFYLAIQDKKFAILGDSGINSNVESDFWDSIKEKMLTQFKEGNFTSGLVSGIEMAGWALKKHFPFHQETDVNELSDEISFGNQ
ncbi:MAG: TPM domain-containing protein [Bacteroidota bacterium]